MDMKSNDKEECRVEESAGKKWSTHPAGVLMLRRGFGTGVMTTADQDQSSTAMIPSQETPFLLHSSTMVDVGSCLA